MLFVPLPVLVSLAYGNWLTPYLDHTPLVASFTSTSLLPVWQLTRTLCKNIPLMRSFVCFFLSLCSALYLSLSYIPHVRQLLGSTFPPCRVPYFYISLSSVAVNSYFLQQSPNLSLTCSPFLFILHSLSLSLSLIHFTFSHCVF